MIRFASPAQQNEVAFLLGNAASLMPEAPCTLAQAGSDTIVISAEVTTGYPAILFEVDADGTPRQNRGITGVEPRG